LTVRSPFVLAACAIAASVFLLPPAAEAQRRGVAVPRRAVVVSRPAVVVRARPTVFVGGYYYPTLYRTSLSVGVGYGYPAYYGGYYGYYGYGPYYGGWPYYQPGPYYGPYDLSGNLRTQVAPRQTEVFIDGYFAGTVDDFDGVFQRLHIEPGDHDVELYLAGHRSYQQRLYLQPGRTFNVRHTMQPLGPGEPEPVRPTGAPLPAAGTRAPGPVTRAPGGGTVTAGPIPGSPGPQSRVPSPGAEGFGELSLRVQPGDAEVTIDGEKWEGSVADERLVVQLSAGLHRLEVRKPGYRNYFTDVTILNGQVRTLNVAMTRE
jgi:hypothetical protein